MPYTVTINATSKCNFKCGMCFRMRFDREGEELETHHFYNILDEMSRYKIQDLGLSGGEPFMRGDLTDIIEYANERHIRVNITTNGALVTKNKLTKIIQSGMNSFTISIDASNPEINDNLRDHQAYQKAISALELIRELRSELGVKCPTAISTVISGLNIDFLVKMVDLASNMNSRIFFQPVLAQYGFFNQSFQYHLLEDVYNRFWV